MKIGDVRILVVDDFSTMRKIIKAMLRRIGIKSIDDAEDGKVALNLLKSHPYNLVILDWNMPGIQGIEICKRLRELKLKITPYLIILTASMNEKKDVLETFRTGANDYMEKPFDAKELIARVKLGEKLIKLEIELADRIKALEEANKHIKTLQGILPICMHCHDIRKDNETWERIDEYISRHTDAQFSHGLCPKCMKKHYPEVSSE